MIKETPIKHNKTKRKDDVERNEGRERPKLGGT